LTATWRQHRRIGVGCARKLRRAIQSRGPSPRRGAKVPAAQRYAPPSRGRLPRGRGAPGFRDRIQTDSWPGPGGCANGGRSSPRQRHCARAARSEAAARAVIPSSFLMMLRATPGWMSTDHGMNKRAAVRARPFRASVSTYSARVARDGDSIEPPDGRSVRPWKPPHGRQPARPGRVLNPACRANFAKRTCRRRSASCAPDRSRGAKNGRATGNR